MHLLHQKKVHDGGKETKPVTKCPHCGRQLMERKGIFHRLTPLSNAFVVHGNCLVCHREDATAEEETEKKKAGRDEHEVSVSENGNENPYTAAYWSLFPEWLK